LPPASLGLLRRVGELAEEQGLPCFAVGGLPRDLLLNRATSDIDIMVEGHGPAFATRLAEALGGRASVEERFLTAKVELPDGTVLDVASARRETYARPGALPEVSPASAQAELARRDFSINALAVRLDGAHFGELFDPLGGAEDIRAGRIRALHRRSFWDDPTRLWRAFRFAGRYGFRLEPRTAEAARDAIAQGVLKSISGKRLGAELRLVFEEPSPLAALRLARDYGALQQIESGLALTPSDEARLERAEEVAAEMAERGRAKEDAASPPAWQLYAASLFLPLGPGGAESACRALDFSAAEARDIAAACAAAPAASAALAAERVERSRIHEELSGAPLLAAWLTLVIAEAERARQRVRLYLDELRHVRLDITGDDLISAGLTPGPSFSRALHAALDAKLDGLAPDAATQLAVAKRAVGRGGGASATSESSPS
jgi:tRNA nucleotidyltransferase (CCA-adding enzyme)